MSRHARSTVAAHSRVGASGGAGGGIGRFAGAAALSAVLAAAACTGGETAPDEPDPGVPDPIRVDLPPLEVRAGGEVPSICQSFTLDNDQPLAINAVHMETGPAWHHSNWFFVPEAQYPGPDGTWDCRDRGFDTLQSGIVGGVLFAQSTQATVETQRFRPGAAVEIPPRSKIVGEVHLVNASDSDLSTAISLDLEPLAPEAFDTPLYTATFVYFDLDIPPMQRSRFGAGCDLSEYYGGPLDFQVHYVLPHYHAFGESLRLEAVGGELDGQVIYENESAIGEPLGGMLEPQFDLTGATGVRFSCVFNNPGSERVEWGLADGEMCVALAFVSGSTKWLAGVQTGSAQASSPDGVDSFEGPCELLAFPGVR